LVGRGEPSRGRLAAGSLIMGAGISGMLYAGLSAIRISPPLKYEAPLVAASVAIAIAASYAALWLALRAQRAQFRPIVLTRILGALLLGGAIAAVHYVGIASTSFASEAHALPGTTLENGWFAIALGLFAFGIMGATLITIVYDAYLARHVRDTAFLREQAHENAR